jgi:hypothetical protein
MRRAKQAKAADRDGALAHPNNHEILLCKC